MEINKVSSTFKDFHPYMRTSVSPPIQENSVVQKKKINKKVLIGAAAATAITAAVIAGIQIGKKRNIPNVEKNIKKFIERANDTERQVGLLSAKVKDEAKDISEGLFVKIEQAADEVLGFFQKGKSDGYQDIEESGKVIRRFILDDKKIPKELLEFDNGGNLTRRSIVENFDSFDINICDLKDKSEIRIRKGSIVSYVKNFFSTSNHNQKAAKMVIFKDGIPETYIEDYEKTLDNVLKVGKKIGFKNRELYMYCEKGEKYPDGLEKRAKNIMFLNGEPLFYTEGCEKYSSSNVRNVKKELCIKDKKPDYYLEGYQKIGDNVEFTDKVLEYTDGIPDTFQTKFEAVQEGIQRFESEFKFNGKKWKKVV